HALENHGMLRQLGGRRGFDVMLARPRRRALGVEHQQRVDVGPAVSDCTRLANERVLLEQEFDRSWGDVLSAGGDDQFLLATNDVEGGGFVHPGQVCWWERCLR